PLYHRGKNIRHITYVYLHTLGNGGKRTFALLLRGDPKAGNAASARKTCPFRLLVLRNGAQTGERQPYLLYRRSRRWLHEQSGKKRALPGRKGRSQENHRGASPHCRQKINKDLSA